MIVPAGPAPTGELEVLATPEIDWTAIVPHLVLMGGALLLLTVSSLLRHRIPAWFYAPYTAAVGVGASLGSIHLWQRVQNSDGPFTALAGAVGIDGFSVFLIVLISASVVLTALLADDYLRREDLVGPELYVLLLLSASGGATMASANDLIVLFLGLEVLSIAVYVLAAMNPRRVQSQEAGLKYFVLGAFSSAFFLYGIALVYGATGSTSLVDVKAFLADTVLVEDGLLLGGFALMLVGLGFKVAAVPFHAWTPDVYEGAPTPVVAYMASGVKAAGFAGLVRVFVLTFGDFATDWQPIVYAVAVVTLLVGAVLAVVQTNVKRMLAYSSISHAGFILVGVQAATARGTSAVLFYLAAYTFMIAGSFGIVTLVGRRGDRRHSLGDYAGLAARRPVLAFTFAVLLLAQAGVPFTSGFVAKFYIIGAAVDARSYWLAVVAMVSAVIAAFLYLRIVVAMYLGTPDEGLAAVRVPAGAALMLVLAVGFTIGFGLFPDPLADLADDAIPALVASEAPG